MDDGLWIAMEYESGGRIELDMDSGRGIYRNVISPRDGGMCFAEGAFDDCPLTLDLQTLQKARELLSVCLKTLRFDEDLPLLPMGASSDAMLKVKNSKGETLYYSNVQPDGWSCKSEEVPETFHALYSCIRQKCSFPELFD